MHFVEMQKSFSICSFLDCFSVVMRKKVGNDKIMCAGKNINGGSKSAGFDLIGYILHFVNF